MDRASRTQCIMPLEHSIRAEDGILSNERSAKRASPLAAEGQERAIASRLGGLKLHHTRTLFRAKSHDVKRKETLPSLRIFISLDD